MSSQPRSDYTRIRIVVKVIMASSYFLLFRGPHYIIASRGAQLVCDLSPLSYDLIWQANGAPWSTAASLYHAGEANSALPNKENVHSFESLQNFSFQSYAEVYVFSSYLGSRCTSLEASSADN